MTTYVIVGGGLAGAKTAEHLRELDGDARIVLVSAEPHPPYERPALSKEFLAGDKAPEDLAVHDPGWYRDNMIELRANTWAESIDPERKTVALADGSSVGYDALALATGSSPRVLPIPGGHRPGVHTLRTLDDAVHLRDALDGSRLLVAGGGWIGLEVAATARGRGAEVTVVELADEVLGVLGPEIGAAFAKLHRDHGVDLRTGVGIESIDGEGRNGAVTGATLSDGSTVEADLVLLALGADPRTELAAAAGLTIDEQTRGVLVDAHLRTSDPDIVAVGDIATEDHPDLGRTRVEHWATALNQPETAAATMVGDDSTYSRRPYFFTDQYDLGMEFRGVLPTDATLVRRGDDAAYLAFWLDGDDIPRAAMNVNIWDAGDDITALLDAAAPVDRERLADPGSPLADTTRG